MLSYDHHNGQEKNGLAEAYNLIQMGIISLIFFYKWISIKDLLYECLGFCRSARKLHVSFWLPIFAPYHFPNNKVH